MRQMPRYANSNDYPQDLEGVRKVKGGDSRESRPSKCFRVEFLYKVKPTGRQTDILLRTNTNLAVHKVVCNRSE